MAAVYKTLSKSSAPQTESTNGVPKKSKTLQRVLILSSRGVTYRHRHLLNDLYSLLPHSRKDAKLDTKTHLYQLNELADLYNCNNVLFFEARKGKDLYVWISKAPNGPTVKMHLQNCEPPGRIKVSVPQADIVISCSTYNVRAELPWQLSERFSPYPLLRRYLHHRSPPCIDQGASHSHLWRPTRRAKDKAVCRSCHGFHNR